MAYYQSSLDFTTDETDEGSDIVYYNADIINGRTSAHPNTYDPVVRFQETRDMPIVRDASQYNFSIVRFTMDGAGRDLPAFIPNIQENQVAPGNINKTVYKFFITATVNGIPYTSSDANSTVYYEPETQNNYFAPAPLPFTIEVGGPGQQVNTRYYWVYTVSHWLSLVNKTLASAWEDVNQQAGGALITRPPYMTWEQTTNLFSIYFDSYGFGGAQRQSAGLAAPLDEELYLYMNSNAFGMFANFDNVFYNTVLAPELNNQIVVKNILGPVGNFVASPVLANGPLPTQITYTLQPPSLPGPFTENLTPTGSNPLVSGVAGWYVMTQDAPSSDSLWSPVASIVFCSTMLPLQNENSGDPVVYGESSFNDIQTVQRAFQPIITDVSIVPDSAMSWKGFISYTPQAEYRLSSFQKSKTPINNIDVQVFWKNRLDGQLYPLEMFNLSSVSIKCMFRKRKAGKY